MFCNGIGVGARPPSISGFSWTQPHIVKDIMYGDEMMNEECGGIRDKEDKQNGGYIARHHASVASFLAAIPAKKLGEEIADFKIMYG